MSNSLNAIPKWVKIGLGCFGAFFIFICLLVAISIAYTLSVTAAPTESAETLFSLIEAGEYDLMYESLSPGLQSSTSKESFIMFVEDYPVMMLMDEVSFTKKKIENDLAMLSGTIYGGGIESYIYVELKHIEDEWLVSLVSFDRSFSVN